MSFGAFSSSHQIPFFTLKFNIVKNKLLVLITGMFLLVFTACQKDAIEMEQASTLSQTELETEASKRVGWINLYWSCNPNGSVTFGELEDRMNYLTGCRLSMPACANGGSFTSTNSSTWAYPQTLSTTISASTQTSLRNWAKNLEPNPLTGAGGAVLDYEWETYTVGWDKKIKVTITYGTDCSGGILGV